MKIANFKDFNAVLRELWSVSSIEEQENYLSELKASGAKRDTNRKKLAAEIKSIKYQINLLRSKIKNIEMLEDKKDISAEIKEYQKLRVKAVKKYAEYDQASRFLALSHDARSYACTDTLLKKYLSAEIMQNNPLCFAKNDEGDIVVDVAALKDSPLYQDAAHIRDYVSAYLSEYPQKAKGASYFKTLLKNINSWNALQTVADDYFAEYNRREAAGKSTAEIIQSSREGFEVVKTYPEQNLQAVRLISQSAFKYEGNEMGHCVAGYYERCHKGESTIYSIRDNFAEGQLSPHATIEFKNGKIAQIKGHSDHAVNHRYMDVTRNFVMELAGLKSLDELKQTENIPASELANLGFVKDQKGHSWDLMKLTDEEIHLESLYAYGDDLDAFDLEKINVKSLTLHGVITAKTIKAAGRLKGLTTMHLKKVKIAKEQFWDFNSLTELQSLRLEDFDFKKDLDLGKCSNLKNLDIRFCRMADGTHLILSPSLEEIALQKPKNEKGFIRFESANNLKKITLDAHSYPTNRVYITTPEELEKNSLDEFKTVLEELVTDNLEYLALQNFKFSDSDNFDFNTYPSLKHLSLISVENIASKQLCLPENLEMFHISDSTLSGIIDLHNCKNLTYFGMTSSDVRSADFLLPQSIKEQKELYLTTCKLNPEFDFAPFENITSFKLGGNDIHERQSELKFPPHITFLDLGGKLPDKIKTLDLSAYKDLKSVTLGGMWSKNMEEIIFPENLKIFDIDEIGCNNSLQKLDFSNCRHMETFDETFMQMFTEIKFPASIKPLKFEKTLFHPDVQITLDAQTPPETVKAFKDHLGEKVVIAPFKPVQTHNRPLQIANLSQLCANRRSM